MKNFLRTFVILPFFALLLVALPAIMLSSTNGFSSAWAKDDPQGTVPTATPTATPTGFPTATPTNTPVKPKPTKTPTRPPVYPTATPTVVPPTATWTTVPPTATPTSTPTPIPLGEAISVGGQRLRKVIGDRLSQVIYGYRTDDRLYRSFDNGYSWQLVTASPLVDDFIMSPADPFTLYSAPPLDCIAGDAVDQPFYVSIDGGAMFEDRAPIMNLQPLLAHPVEEDTVLAAGCDGVYLSEDGGRTWQVRSNTGESALWRDYTAVEMAASYLAGEPGPSEANWEHLYVVAKRVDGASIVAYSGDVGNTWGQITPADAQTLFYIGALTADSTVAGRVWLAERLGVWATEDLGNFWGLTNRGLENVSGDELAAGAVELNDVVQLPSERLFLAAADGLYTKLTSEAVWQKVTNEVFDLLDVQGLLFTDSKLDKLWLNTDDGVYTYKVQD